MAQRGTTVAMDRQARDAAEEARGRSDAVRNRGAVAAKQKNNVAIARWIRIDPRTLLWDDVSGVNALRRGPIARRAARVLMHSFLILAIASVLAVFLGFTNPRDADVGVNATTVHIHKCHVMLACESHGPFHWAEQSVSRSDTEVDIDGSGTERCTVNLCVQNYTTRTEALTFILSKATIDLTAWTEAVPFSVSVKSKVYSGTLQQEAAKVTLGAGRFHDLFINVSRGVVSAEYFAATTATIIVYHGPVMLDFDFTNAPFKITGTTRDEAYCVSPKLTAQTFTSGPCGNVTTVSENLNASTRVCPYTAESTTGSNPLMSLSITASSVYFNAANDTNETRIAGEGMHEDPRVDFTVLSQLADTDRWHAEQLQTLYVQVVDVITPTLGIAFSIASRKVLMEIGPNRLAFYSAFVMQPHHRRMRAVLTHYGCPAGAPRSLMDNLRPHTLTAYLSREADTEAMLREKIDRFFPPEMQFMVAMQIYDVVGDSNAIVGVDSQAHKRKTWHEKVFGSARVVLKRDEDGIVTESGLKQSGSTIALIIINYIAAMVMLIGVNLVILIYRREIIDFVLLIDMRKKLRDQITREIPLCAYHYYLSFNTLITWVAFRVVCRLVFFGSTPSSFIATYFRPTDEQSEGIVTPLVFERVQQMYRYWSLQRYDTPTATEFDLTGAIESNGGQRLMLQKPVVRGLKLRDPVPSGAVAKNLRLRPEVFTRRDLKRFFTIEDSNTSFVLLDDVVLFARDLGSYDANATHRDEQVLQQGNGLAKVKHTIGTLRHDQCDLERAGKLRDAVRARLLALHFVIDSHMIDMVTGIELVYDDFRKANKKQELRVVTIIDAVGRKIRTCFSNADKDDDSEKTEQQKKEDEKQEKREKEKTAQLEDDVEAVDELDNAYAHNHDPHEGLELSDENHKVRVVFRMLVWIFSALLVVPALFLPTIFSTIFPMKKNTKTHQGDETRRKKQDQKRNETEPHALSTRGMRRNTERMERWAASWPKETALPGGSLFAFLTGSPPLTRKVPRLGDVTRAWNQKLYGTALRHAIVWVLTIVPRLVLGLVRGVLTSFFELSISSVLATLLSFSPFIAIISLNVLGDFQRVRYATITDRNTMEELYASMSFIPGVSTYQGGDQSFRTDVSVWMLYLFTVMYFIEPLLIVLTFKSVGVYSSTAPWAEWVLCYVRIAWSLSLCGLYWMACCGLICYICLAISWWVLGAIIAPDYMLVVATAVITFFVATARTLSSYMDLRTESVEEMQQKIMELFLAIIRRTPAESAISFAQNARGQVEEAAGCSLMITAGTLMDAASTDPNAALAGVAELAMAHGVPDAVILLLLAAASRTPESIERGVKAAFKQLSIDDELSVFGTQMACLAAGAPTSTQQLASSLIDLLPDDYHIQSFARENQEILAGAIRALSLQNGTVPDRHVVLAFVTKTAAAVAARQMHGLIREHTLVDLVEVARRGINRGAFEDEIVLCRSLAEMLALIESELCDDHSDAATVVSVARNISLACAGEKNNLPGVVYDLLGLSDSAEVAHGEKLKIDGFLDTLTELVRLVDKLKLYDLPAEAIVSTVNAIVSHDGLFNSIGLKLCLEHRPKGANDDPSARKLEDNRARPQGANDDLSGCKLEDNRFLVWYVLPQRDNDEAREGGEKHKKTLHNVLREARAFHRRLSDRRIEHAAAEVDTVLIEALQAYGRDILSEASGHSSVDGDDTGAEEVIYGDFIAALSAQNSSGAFCRKCCNSCCSCCRRSCTLTPLKVFSRNVDRTSVMNSITSLYLAGSCSMIDSTALTDCLGVEEDVLEILVNPASLADQYTELKEILPPLLHCASRRHMDPRNTAAIAQRFADDSEKCLHRALVAAGDAAPDQSVRVFLWLTGASDNATKADICEALGITATSGKSSEEFKQCLTAERDELLTLGRRVIERRGILKAQAVTAARAKLVTKKETAFDCGIASSCREAFEPFHELSPDPPKNADRDFNNGFDLTQRCRHHITARARLDTDDELAAALYSPRPFRYHTLAINKNGTNENDSGIAPMQLADLLSCRNTNELRLDSRYDAAVQALEKNHVSHTENLPEAERKLHEEVCSQRAAMIEGLKRDQAFEKMWRDGQDLMKDRRKNDALIKEQRTQLEFVEKMIVARACRDVMELHPETIVPTPGGTLPSSKKSAATNIDDLKAKIREACGDAKKLEWVFAHWLVIEVAELFAPCIFTDENTTGQSALASEQKKSNGRNPDDDDDGKSATIEKITETDRLLFSPFDLKHRVRAWAVRAACLAMAREDNACKSFLDTWKSIHDIAQGRSTLIHHARDHAHALDILRSQMDILRAQPPAPGEKDQVRPEWTDDIVTSAESCVSSQTLDAIRVSVIEFVCAPQRREDFARARSKLMSKKLSGRVDRYTMAGESAVPQTRHSVFTCGHRTRAQRLLAAWASVTVLGPHAPQPAASQLLSIVLGPGQLASIAIALMRLRRNDTERLANADVVALHRAINDVRLWRPAGFTVTRESIKHALEVLYPDDFTPLHVLQALAQGPVERIDGLPITVAETKPCATTAEDVGVRLRGKRSPMLRLINTLPQVVLEHLNAPQLSDFHDKVDAVVTDLQKQKDKTFAAATELHKKHIDGLFIPLVFTALSVGPNLPIVDCSQMAIKWLERRWGFVMNNEPIADAATQVEKTRKFAQKALGLIQEVVKLVPGQTTNVAAIEAVGDCHIEISKLLKLDDDPIQATATHFTDAVSLLLENLLALSVNAPATNSTTATTPPTPPTQPNSDLARNVALLDSLLSLGGELKLRPLQQKDKQTSSLLRRWFHQRLVLERIDHFPALLRMLPGLVMSMLRSKEFIKRVIAVNTAAATNAARAKVLTLSEVIVMPSFATNVTFSQIEPALNAMFDVAKLALEHSNANAHQTMISAKATVRQALKRVLVIRTSEHLIRDSILLGLDMTMTAIELFFDGKCVTGCTAEEAVVANMRHIIPVVSAIVKHHHIIMDHAVDFPDKFEAGLQAVIRFTGSAMTPRVAIRDARKKMDAAKTASVSAITKLKIDVNAKDIVKAKQNVLAAIEEIHTVLGSFLDAAGVLVNVHEFITQAPALIDSIRSKATDAVATMVQNHLSNLTKTIADLSQMKCDNFNAGFILSIISKVESAAQTVKTTVAEFKLLAARMKVANLERCFDKDSEFQKMLAPFTFLQAIDTVKKNAVEMALKKVPIFTWADRGLAALAAALEPVSDAFDAAAHTAEELERAVTSVMKDDKGKKVIAALSLVLDAAFKARAFMLKGDVLDRSVTGFAMLLQCFRRYVASKNVVEHVQTISEKIREGKDLKQYRFIRSLVDSDFRPAFDAVLSFLAMEPDGLQRVIACFGIIRVDFIGAQLVSTLDALYRMSGVVVKAERLKPANPAERVAWQIFAEVDSNGNDEISIDEFQDALRRLHFPLSDAQSKSLFKEMDITGRGVLVREDFLRSLLKIRDWVIDEILAELHLTKSIIYAAVAYVAVIVLILLVFIVCGAYAFSDGTIFTACITGLMPLAAITSSAASQRSAAVKIKSKVVAVVDEYFHRLQNTFTKR